MTLARSQVIDTRKAVESLGRAAIVYASELTMLVSTATRTPVAMVVGAPENGLRRPRSQSLPLRPVLLVHGFCGSDASWTVVVRALQARGAAVESFTYLPFGTSVERLADRLVTEVRRILSETGADKIHLVGHSLGGILIAQAIADDRLRGRVDTVVTLGAPFGGSPWAKLLPFGAIARALREDSPVLRRLACEPPPTGVRWLAFTAPLDFVVPGGRSVPGHGQAERVTVGGVGHLGMLMNRHVVDRIAEALPVCRIADALSA